MKRIVLLGAITVATALGGSALPVAAKTHPGHTNDGISASVHKCGHATKANKDKDLHGDCASSAAHKNR